MDRGLTGRYETISVAGGEVCKAFIPNPLPPDPPLQIDENLREALDRALIALGRMDSISTLLPDPSLFLYMYIRKEAVLSSQIEGTQSSLSDLLLFESEEAPGVPLDDVQEVSNYVAALNHGVDRIKGGFPLSLRLLREIHEVLLKRGRGSDRDPGHFRRSQNWIGGTRPGNAMFVPPPANQVTDLIGTLEKFLHDDPHKTPVLIKAALAHAQFETIHPFLDGNGRLGRLLITLLLYSEGVLTEPILYLSLYLKTNRDRYYDLLQAIRKDGNWEEWLSFFAEGVRETATSAVHTSTRLVKLFADDRARIQEIGRSAGSALRAHEALQQRPIASIGRIAEISGLTVPTATSALKNLERLNLVIEITGKERRRRFAYDEYLKILNEGTET